MIVDMVFRSDSVQWQEADSVLEALILEANLIKKHKPYYNVREKDDRSFNYVVITKEKLPKVLVIRGQNLKNYAVSNFFSLRTAKPNSSLEKIRTSSVSGPYTNGGQLREAMK